MSLRLISFKTCPFVQRAVFALEEKGAPYTIEFIDLANKPAWFLAISPRGKVPVLLADGRPLFESAVINEFLDETHPPRMMPDDPFERAVQRAWVEVSSDLLMTQYRLCSAKTREEREAAHKPVDATLARLDQAIAERVIDADAFGIVHVALAPALHRFVVIEDALGARFFAQTPRLEALARAIARRPSVTSTVVADFDARFVADLRKRGSALAA